MILSCFPGVGLLDMAFEQEGFCVVRGPDVIFGGDIRLFHPPAGKFDGVIGGPPCQAFSQLRHLVKANGCTPKFGNLIPEFERCVLDAAPLWFLMENVPQAPTPAVPGYGVKSFILDNSMLDGGDGWGLEQRRVRRFSFGMRDREVPNLMNWIDLATFVLPDAAGSGLSQPVDNSQEAKRRVPAGDGGHADPNESLTAARRTRKQAVLGDPNPVLVKIGGSGKIKKTAIRTGTVIGSDGGKSGRMSRYRFAEACRLQGLPEDFLKDAPFTAEGKLKAVANGVALPTGRAIARAIKCALEIP